VLRWYGAEGLRQHIRSGVALAQRFAELVRADERFEIVAPHPLSLVCFALREGNREGGTDGHTEALHRRLVAEGTAALTHTRVNGRYAIRLAVGAPSTEERHVLAVWQRVRSIADEMAS
jgi:aromatic-L-amino-acid/L-tryptophan decarboxylase